MSATTKVIASATAAASYSPADAAAISAFRAGKHACIILGATGAVGKAVVRDIMETDAFEKVTLLVRREVEYEGPHAEKLRQEKVDFDNLKESSFAGHDVVFCALGTTRAQAGSAEAFRKIDHDYVLNAAKVFKSANPNKPLQFHYASSGGANASSWLLYPKTKGEIENALRDMNFARCGLFRYALLGIEEERKDKRFGENMAHAVSGLLPAKWVTPVSVAARSMRRWAIGGEGVPVKEGTTILENEEVLKLGA
ncbi:hypothetical protein HK104_010982 [Borealophlyctis nickersoniae]|nr:hypothetical protein HK104_010982 [Borealophlyctis nickersoniae]